MGTILFNLKMSPVERDFWIKVYLAVISRQGQQHTDAAKAADMAVHALSTGER